MAGVFQELVTLVNRAPINLQATFDGQSATLVPGENMVPKVIVSFAKNQNPVMGSADPYNPHISGGRYLVGVKGTKDDIIPLTQDEWEEHLKRPCREDEQIWFADKYGSDPKAKIVSYGKGRKSMAGSRHDAGGSPKGTADFSGRE